MIHEGRADRKPVRLKLERPTHRVVRDHVEREQGTFLHASRRRGTHRQSQHEPVTVGVESGLRGAAEFRDRRETVAPLSHHDRRHDLLLLAGRQREGTGRDLHAAVQRSLVQPSGARHGIAGHLERRDRRRRIVVHVNRSAVRVQPPHVVVRLQGIGRIGAVPVHGEGGHAERIGHAPSQGHEGALEELKTDGGRHGPVLGVRVRRVVGEAERERRIAPREIVAGSADIGVGPERNVSLIERVETPVSNLQLDEDDVAERSRAVEGEHRLANLDAERPYGVPDRACRPIAA